MASRLAGIVGPVVEQVAQLLAHGQGTAAKPLTAPTLLTQANRSAGRDSVRTAAKRESSPVKLEAPAGCRECGVVLEDRERHYCDDCLPDAQEVQRANFSTAGRARLQELRASGVDSSQTGEAAEKRRSVMRQRRQEERAWEAEHGPAEVNEVTFRTEILPGLQGMSLAQISEATGLSQQYCSLIRRGLKVPHPRHWEGFRSIASGENP